MIVLIVEDNKSERELLRYMLEARFQHSTKFREASDLKAAVEYLRRGDVDCVLLDLQLPDSVGKETFTKLARQYPGVPIIVMTNTKDRDLAIELVRLGAADYMIKDFTDEESIFQRILVAIEKHKYTVRVPEEAAISVRKMENAQARLLTAHESGEHRAIQIGMVETTTTTADLTRKMFTEIQKLQAVIIAQGKDITHVIEVTDKLQREILEGSLTKPSMKARVAMLEQNVQSVISDTKGDGREQAELYTKVRLLDQHVEQMSSRLYSDIRGLKAGSSARAEMASQVDIAIKDNRAKVWVAILGLIGVIVGGAIAAHYSSAKDPDAKVQKP